MSNVDGVVVVTLRGELDMQSAETLLAVLEDVPPAQPVLVDTANLEFMDSNGLSVLLVQQTWRGRNGGSLRISNPSAAVRRLVTIAGLGEFLFDGPASNDG